MQSWLNCSLRVAFDGCATSTLCVFMKGFTSIVNSKIRRRTVRSDSQPCRRIQVKRFRSFEAMMNSGASKRTVRTEHVEVQSLIMSNTDNCKTRFARATRLTSCPKSTRASLESLRLCPWTGAGRTVLLSILKLNEAPATYLSSQHASQN